MTTLPSEQTRSTNAWPGRGTDRVRTGILLDAAGATDRGCVREHNEDQFAIVELTRGAHVHDSSLPAAHERELSAGVLFAVADGLGGHARGDLASETAVRTALDDLTRTLACRADDTTILDGMEAAVHHAHRDITALAQHADPAVADRPPGTTLTMAFMAWPTLYIAHVGDSRLYVISSGRLQQVTHDHTAAQALLERNQATASELDGSRLHHMLANAVGGGTQGAPRCERQQLKLRSGDALILCSDGLSGHVDDAAIHRVVASAASSRAACSALIEAAKAGGGSDNITVVVARALPA